MPMHHWCTTPSRIYRDAASGYLLQRAASSYRTYEVCSFAYVRKIGISAATFHTLRHTFASHLLTRKGVDIETVSKLLGHSSIETTMIYLHTNMEIMRSGVERLDFVAEKNPWHKSGTNEKASTRKSRPFNSKKKNGGEGGIRTLDRPLQPIAV